jgi:hypothetical protein
MPALEAAPAPRSSRVGSWWPLLGLAALAVLPAVAALVRLRDERWFPTGDMAQAELHMRGIWSHPPLVGAAGRITSDAGVQGSHPGPSLWFAMYPVYALFGRTSFGLMAAVTSVHLAGFIGALVLARRRGGTPLLLAVGLLLIVLVRSNGPMVFIEPWNPWLAIFPFLVFLLAMAEVAEGRVKLLPLAVITGSHCIQCHTGYLVIVLGLLGAGTAWALVLAWRAGGLVSIRRESRWLAASVAAGFLMWLLPLIDQVTRTPGNLTILAENFGTPNEPYLAKGLVARVTLSQLSLFGPWLTGPSLITRNLPAVALTAVLWGAAGRVAWRSRDTRALTMHGGLALAVLIGLFSVERIFGGYLEYTIRWFWVVTGLIVVVSAWTLWRSARPRRLVDRGREVGVALVAGSILVTAVATVQFTSRVELTGRPDSELVGAVVDEVEAGLEPDGSYLVRWFDPVGLGAVPFGLVLELARRGFSTGVDPQFAAAALPQRVLPEAEADGVLYVVLGAKIEDVASSPGVTRIGAADLRTPSEIARSEDLTAFLRARFAELGRPELVDRLDAQYGRAGLLFVQPPLPLDAADAVSELVALRLPVAVFLAPPGTEIPALA